MTTLTDYLDGSTLQQLQDIFTRATRAPLRIYDAEGKPLTEPSDTAVGLDYPGSAGQPNALAAPQQVETSGPVSVPLIVRDLTLGRIVLEEPGSPRWSNEQARALAEALKLPQQKISDALQLMPEVDAQAKWSALELLRLMSNVIARLCAQEEQLRARVEELSTLYKLTSLFTAQRDLPKMLQTVANTVVELLDVKACNIRLLDRETNELTVQAVANLSQEYLNKGPIRVSDSVLDSEAFAKQDVVYVEDERNDPRVLYPAEARREGLVSALIAPLMYRGKPVGVLRLYTAQRHLFSRFETALVKAIAGQAAAAIVNAQLHIESAKADAMRRQIQLAGEVQGRMIPAGPPKVPGLDLAALYVPSLTLSGDFYDFIELPAGNLGIAVCDVMGKGIPASLLMASIRASLRAHVYDLYDLSEVLRRVNRSLCDDTLTTDFATLFYGVINTRKLELTHANAGHEPPMLFREGQIHTLSTGGTVLGIERDLRYAQKVTQLRKKDVLVLMTDGIIEGLNFQNEMFGRERVRQAAMTAIERGDDANGIAQYILWSLRRFTGLQVHGDDLTLVVIKVI